MKRTSKIILNSFSNAIRHELSAGLDDATFVEALRERLGLKEC